MGKIGNIMKFVGKNGWAGWAVLVAGSCRVVLAHRRSRRPKHDTSKMRVPCLGWLQYGHARADPALHCPTISGRAEKPRI